MLKPLIVACVACLTAACTTVPMGTGPDIAQLQSEAESQTRRVPTHNRCIRATGTRIVRPDRCLPAQGRVYTPDEIGSAGALSTGEALRRLDPSMR